MVECLCLIVNDAQIWVDEFCQFSILAQNRMFLTRMGVFKNHLWGLNNKRESLQGILVCYLN